MRRRLQSNRCLRTYMLLLCACLVLPWHAASAQFQQPGVSLSSALPVIDGWTSLKISTQVAYRWSHVMQQANGTAGSSSSSTDDSSSSSSSSKNSSMPAILAVPRRGTAVARLRTHVIKAVSKASFGLSGSLGVSNPDPTASILIDSLQLQCQWGLDMALPCAPQQPVLGQPKLQLWPAGPSAGSSKAPEGQASSTEGDTPTLVLHPGQTVQCSIRGLAVEATWGANFRQSCRILATTWNGGKTTSGHFMLDFAAPDVMSVQNDCVRLKTQCDVQGSDVYSTPGTGQQLQQGVLVCADRLLETRVLVSDGYTKEEELPDDCPGNSTLACSSELVRAEAEQAVQQDAGQAGGSSSVSSVSSVAPQLHQSSLDLNIMSSECAAQLKNASNATQAEELMLESAAEDQSADVDDEPSELVDSEVSAQTPSRLPSRLQLPKLKLKIDGTYIVNNFTWLVSSSVAPEQLQVYANSTAPAQFTVTALRVPVRPSAPPKFFVEGTITVQNPSSGQIDVAGVNAVLPWGEAALCKPTDDMVYPAKLDASAKLTCTFRLEYKLGLKPSSLRAHLSFVGSPNVLKSWPKPFSFDRPDLSWSPGACARVSTSFTADSPDVSVTHAGGEAPAFGEPGTEVCQDFAKWEFTLLVTPVDKTDGVVSVVANTVVTPTSVPEADSSSSMSRSTVTVLAAEVLPWPLAASGPLITAAGSWRRGGEVPVVSAQGGDGFLFGERNESVVIRVPF